MTIQEAIIRLENISASELASQVVSENVDALVLELRDQLERRHQKKSGLIGEYKSGSYVSWKSKRATKSKFFNGKEVDLFLTGQFQESIIITVDGDKYNIDSTDFKKEFLTAMYGEDILAFNEESLQELREFLLPLFIEKLEEIL